MYEKLSGVDEFFTRIGLTAPPRSVLYSLEPIGLGTPMVECLTSYISRLAKAHQVSVLTLLRFIISRSRWNHLMSISTQFLNGMDSTEYITESLEGLTCRNDIRYLSTMHWRGRIKRGYLKKNKTWCPLCFQKWKETGRIIYEPLIWHIDPITICFQHHVPLHTECPACLKKNRVLENSCDLGTCAHCSSFLGFNLEATHGSPFQLSANEVVGKIIGGEEGIDYLRTQIRYSAWQLRHAIEVIGKP